jgi:hypothetical protein
MHCFLVRIELVFERNTSSHWSFQGGRMLMLLQTGLFRWVEETYIYLERKPSMLEAGASSTFFPSENWVSVWKESFPQLWCFRWRYALLVPNRPTQLNWRNTCMSPIKTIHVRRYLNSSPLFPCENWVSFWKEYFLQITVFKVKIGFVCSHRPIQLSWRNTSMYLKKTIYVRSCSI